VVRGIILRPQTHEIVYSDEIKKGGPSAALLFLRTGRVRAIFLAGDDDVFGRAFSASVAVPTTRETNVGLSQRRNSVRRCNFAARFMNCVLINYPAAEKRRWGSGVMRISGTLDENPRLMAMRKKGNSIAATKGSRTGKSASAQHDARPTALSPH
jgi:hypothetical protein